MTKERAPFDTCNKKDTIENRCELITAVPINVHVSLLGGKGEVCPFPLVFYY